MQMMLSEEKALGIDFGRRSERDNKLCTERIDSDVYDDAARRVERHLKYKDFSSN